MQQGIWTFMEYENNYIFNAIILKDMYNIYIGRNCVYCCADFFKSAFSPGRVFEEWDGWA